MDGGVNGGRVDDRGEWMKEQKDEDVDKGSGKRKEERRERCGGSRCVGQHVGAVFYRTQDPLTPTYRQFSASTRPHPEDHYQLGCWRNPTDQR